MDHSVLNHETEPESSFVALRYARATKNHETRDAGLGVPFLRTSITDTSLYGTTSHSAKAIGNLRCGVVTRAEPFSVRNLDPRPTI